MHSTITTNPQHIHHHSLNEVKDYLVSHEDFLDNIFEKIIDAGGFIIVMTFIYMVMLMVYTLNNANNLFEFALSYLSSNMLQEFMHNIVHGFI